MINLINSKSDTHLSGAIIKDGTITAVNKVNLDPFLEEVARFREDYHNGEKPKDMHHIARFEASVLENIRLLNKWPATQEGQKLALKEALRMVKTGELKAFAIHDY
jgi:hypothetical protein